MAKSYGRYPDVYRYPWEVTAKNRYSKRLAFVDYYDNEKEARAEAKKLRGGDYIVKVRNVIESTGRTMAK